MVSQASELTTQLLNNAASELHRENTTNDFSYLLTEKKTNGRSGAAFFC